MNDIVVADVEGDLSVYVFSRPGFARLFARKLNDGGYRADVQSIPTRTNGDEELMQILSDEFGPDAAAATLELIRIEEANAALFERTRALRRTVEVAGQLNKMLNPEDEK